MDFYDYINKNRDCDNCSKARRLGLGITCRGFHRGCFCTKHKMKMSVYKYLSKKYKEGGNNGNDSRTK